MPNCTDCASMYEVVPAIASIECATCGEKWYGCSDCWFGVDLSNPAACQDLHA